PDLVEPASRLSVEALRDRMASVPNLVLLDVRNPGEVALGMLPGAVHISLPALLNRLDELDPVMPTVVYCAGGYRSSIAASMLRSHGFADVSDLLGGYTAWLAAMPMSGAGAGA
ncbi:MAG: rhodanese-like domain-containing protein, partial [Acidimicrobiia bacterium]|nr:rhodanese-like domain-containing protein [Acidimicrobiia bacterium]